MDDVGKIRMVRMVWRDDQGHEVDLGPVTATTDEHGIHIAVELAGRVPEVPAGHTFSLTCQAEPAPYLGAWVSQTARGHLPG
jgi:hypothetical protein